MFLNSKKLLAKKTTTGVRYFKKIGLGRSPHIYLFAQLLTFYRIGFKTPVEAIDGQFVDKKCPFTSDVSIRGRIFK